MQTLAAGVWRALSQGAPGARVIAHGGSNRGLPAWLIGALPMAGLAIARRQVDSVLTGDALMYALMRPLIAMSGLPHATMVIGLDVTYPNRIYRSVVHPALRRAPRLIAISRATANAAEGIGVDPTRITVIRLGLAPPGVTEADKRDAAEAVRGWLGIRADQLIVLTLGRLVRRKGVAWFVERVLPILPSNVVYVVAGSGPQAGELSARVAELRLEDRVRLVGAVDDTQRERLLRGADLFVQPNVHVPGDIEGFGLVVLEAAMRGTPTVASGIDGILDAVIDDVTGVLLPPQDERVWITRLTSLLSAPGELAVLGRQYGEAAQRLYSEEQMGLHLLRSIAGNPQRA